MTRSRYLSASLLVGALTLAQGGHAASFKVIHAFKDGNDGATPWTTRLINVSGNWYGTGLQGGIYNNGTIFVLTPEGKEKTLYSFAGAPSDGWKPLAGLIADSAGNFYGTTNQGGTSDTGIVFKYASNGQETVLHDFTGGSDGGNPEAALVQDQAGNLYGTTVVGGDQSCGCGTVFEIAANGTFSVLHTFTDGSDGQIPEGTLAIDASGNLYGTAIGGGANGFGTLFKITQGRSFSVLYAFSGGSDGANPKAGPILDTSGNIYGTTALGGVSNQGTVFKVSAWGKESILHAFTGGSGGSEPYIGVSLDSSGNLYGGTAAGGNNGDGVLFRVSTKGSFAVLHILNGNTDGEYPSSVPVTDQAGYLIGTTYAGGADGWGTIYRLAK